MNVSQVVRLAKEWVQLHGIQIPSFCGAFLTGGIVTMSPDALFPPYRDVDLIIVLRAGGNDSQENEEWQYHGLILECGFGSLAQYRSPETVLANPYFAHCFAVDSILSDPTQLLTRTHEVVAREYARRRWVLTRCDYVKKRVLGHLEQLSQVNSPFVILHELWNFAISSLNPPTFRKSLAVMKDMALLPELWEFAYSLSGLIAISSLRPPTFRRSLALMKELLQDQDRLDLHEELLNVLGCAHLSRENVESYLQECSLAFDRAVAVKQAPSLYGYKLRPHVRPYVIDGAQEMINEGIHREAMLWIGGFLGISFAAILNDGSEEERKRFQATFERLLSDLGLRTLDDLRCRLRQARKVADDIFEVADEIVQRNPDIMD